MTPVFYGMACLVEVEILTPYLMIFSGGWPVTHNLPAMAWDYSALCLFAAGGVLRLSCNSS